MPTAKEIALFIDKLLDIRSFSADASNNGLQFDAGNAEVERAVFGVDACLDLFNAAADEKANFVFVHHGISWGGSLKRIASIDAARIAKLASSGISLYAAHLPLDAHPEVGHNAAIARMLELKNLMPFGMYNGMRIGFSGTLPKPVAAGKLAEKIHDLLPYTGNGYSCADEDRIVRTIGVISGGGAFSSAFQEMADSGIDCLVTGEFTHQAWHYAKEAEVAVIAEGHYRTEIPGVLNVMQAVAEEFGIECIFREIPTGL